MKKRKAIKFLTTFLFLVTCYVSIIAQSGIDRMVDAKEVTTLIDSIAKLAASNYISEDMGIQIAKYVKDRHADGDYNNKSLKELAEMLTKDLRTVSGDAHMSAFYREHKQTVKENFLDHKLNERGADSNYGFVETSILKPNVGYLKIAHFTSPQFLQEAKKAADHSMAILKSTDALIIDVRENPGGFEEIVAYFISHFFEGEPIYLQEYYARYLDRRRSISTTNVIPGKKLPNLPVYILTSKKTGSAGESLAYLMKHLNRAQIVGETTRGAGNGSTYFRVSNDLMVQIATWETINNVTKSSWEKVGVVPTISTTSEVALDSAMTLAKVAAEEHRLLRTNTYKTLWADLDKALDKDHPNASDEIIVNSILACHQEGLINEYQINVTGYDFLTERKKTITAEAIFKLNTMLYPDSPNVYDSYGDALSTNGKHTQAITNYAKAVELAKESGDANLELFRKNLEKAKKEVTNQN